MCSGVRSALGPGWRSLRRENSLQGGAAQRAPTRPLDATRSSNLYCVSSRMLHVGSLSRSNGEKQSALSACMATVRGALMPEKTSRKRRGGAACLGRGCATGVLELLVEELDDDDLLRFGTRVTGRAVQGGGGGAGAGLSKRCAWESQEGG